MYGLVAAPCRLVRTAQSVPEKRCRAVFESFRYRFEPASRLPASNASCHCAVFVCNHVGVPSVVPTALGGVIEPFCIKGIFFLFPELGISMT